MGHSIDKLCYAFSAGKLLAASSLHCVNCSLNLSPCFFKYCTCHVTISTSCVWLKEWFNPLCLLQSTAISRTHSSLTLNQKMHKQQTCVAYKWACSLCRHLCLRSDVIRKKNARRIKTITSLRWRTVQYRILHKPGSCSLWRRHFLMHAERKTA